MLINWRFAFRVDNLIKFNSLFHTSKSKLHYRTNNKLIGTETNKKLEHIIYENPY